MRRYCSPIILGMTTALCSTAAYATDFFVQASRPGPVTGTALAVVTLQAETNDTTSTGTVVLPGTQVDDPDPTATSSGGGSATTDSSDDTAVKSNNGGGKGAKWVSAPPKKGGKGGGTSTTDTTTGSTGSTTTDTGGTTTTSGTGGTSTTTTGTGSTTTTTDTGGSTTTAGTGGTTTTTSGSGGTTSTSTSTSTTTSGTTSSTSTSTSTTSPAPAPSGQTWPSVGAVLASGQVRGGDRIFLMDGYHGPLTIRDYTFSSPVVIAAASGHVAHVDSITVRNSSNLVLQGLKVWATSANAGNGHLIRSYPDTRDLAFTDLDVRAVPTSANYLQWTLTDWKNNQRNGFFIDGRNVTVARNRVTGIYHGILSLAANALVEENIVDGFSGDGMRANGDDSIVRRNKVQNCFQIDGNHADGFQSFSRGTDGKVGTGTVRNLTVEGNKIFEWTASASNPLRCKLQGISMFDGMYDGAVIRNNIVSSKAYHGITINGALNSKIVNNTVIDADGVKAGWPWIRLSPHKNGTPPHNVTVANNLANSIKPSTDPVKQIVVTNNVVVTNAGNEFTAVTKQDFTLKPTAKGIDAGTATFAPPTDIVGAKRPKGAAPDAGSYESF